MYDAIVVGARVAGAPTAMLLARKGYRVLLVDRASFPSDTPKGHYLQPSGVAYLRRWGLLERIAVSTPPVQQAAMNLGPFVLRGSPRWPNGEPAVAYAPRRSLLDQVLVEASVAAGAELRERFAVESLTWEDGRVSGLRGRTGGSLVSESARLVIGADGTHSRVAAAVGAPTYFERPALAGAYWGYWSGVPMEGLEFCPRDGVGVGAFPTNDGLTCVFGQWRRPALPAVRANVERSLFEALELAPELAERVRRGRRETAFEGRLDLYNFFRRPYGPGWALVGDAGYLKDPITGQGMNDAFRDAELLTDAIDAGLTGRRPLELALADYEQARNEQARPMYDFTYQLGALEPPPPEMQELFGALRENQAEADRFFGTIAGTVPVQEFFAPDNLARIVGRAPEGAPPLAA